MTIPDSFKRASVLIVGDVMLDTYLWGRVDRISPEAPVPVVELERTSSIPGGAANVAANVVGLRASAYLVGSVGADAEGETLRRSLERCGVGLAGLVSSSTSATTHKTRVIAHSQQVVRIDRERRGDLSDHDLAKVRDSVEAAIPQVQAVIVSDYAKGLLSSEFVTWLIRAARAADKIVCVDPKGRDYARYKGASLVTPNKREAADACGLSFDAPEMVGTAGHELLTSLECDAVVITEGEHGMTVFERDAEPYHFEASSQEVYDVTGAGDTVIATLATSLAAGLSLRSAAEIATIAAGVVVQQVGTTAISADALERELSGRQ
jgi:D-beta-D-heptose 7-phosphate kinase/D-beta-D-heptose 1-phosphate adenosyltransferase